MSENNNHFDILIIGSGPAGLTAAIYAVRGGATVCTTDGIGVECGAVAGDPVDELCGNGIDDDCDEETDEGFDVGAACTSGLGVCEVAGSRICAPDGVGTVCDATPGQGTAEQCNDVDDDCDGDVDEDFAVGAPCDGGDGDLCAEGVNACDGGGAAVCTDTTGTLVDVCNGLNDDCDPASADGSEDPGVGVLCDGPDSDLCTEGARACVSGNLECGDSTGSALDTCNGLDDDCDPASADGSEDAAVGLVCDGPDSDLCTEGLRSCTGGGLVCSDATGSTVDLCDGTNNDCDPTSADGSEDPGLGAPCDGTDTDLCNEGSRYCSAANLLCNDSSGSTVDLCDGTNDDCDPASADGSEDPLTGTSCDGNDGDLCAEGTVSCVAGGVACSDATGTTSEICNGIDDDCNGGADDGITHDDNPLCASGTQYLGPVSGDTGNQIVSDAGNDEEWDRFTLTEDNASSLYLSATVTLTSPPGADFDLYVYCVSCGGTLAGSSDSGLEGETDTVLVRRTDEVEDDDADLIIEVRHYSSTVCANWTLQVQGNTVVSTANCFD